MVKGQCNCSGVAFEADGDLFGIVVCHCSICRRATGSNGIAVVLVDNDAFRWTRGEELVSTWKKPDADWQVWFCRICGSPLPGENDAKRTYIPAGTIIEGADSLEVLHHVYVDSKAAWDVIGDSGKLHPGAFEG